MVRTKINVRDTKLRESVTRKLNQVIQGAISSLV